MPQQPDELSALRAAIDGMDAQILELLKERSRIVKKVGELKTRTVAPGLSFIRPAREATMVKARAQHIGNEFPPAAVASMWRMIISASLAMEQAMNITAFQTPDHAECYWLAREYFGVVMPIQSEERAEKVIQSVATGEASIGVLPLLDDEENPWWLRPSAEKNRIYVFARLPFITTKWMKETPSLVIANVMPEPSGNDMSVIAIRTKHSANDVLKICSRDGKNWRVLAQSNEGILVETEGFLSPETSLSHLAHELATDLSNIRLLGAYAEPLVF